MINNWKESLKWISKIFFLLKCIYNTSVLYIAWMFNQLWFEESSVPGVLWYICAKQATWMSKTRSGSSWVETDLTQFVVACAWEKLALDISAALCRLKGSWKSLNFSCCSTYRRGTCQLLTCSLGPASTWHKVWFLFQLWGKIPACFNQARGTGVQNEWMFERSSWCLSCTKYTCQVPCCRYFSWVGCD